MDAQESFLYHAHQKLVTPRIDRANVSLPLSGSQVKGHYTGELFGVSLDGYPLDEVSDIRAFTGGSNFPLVMGLEYSLRVLRNMADANPEKLWPLEEVRINKDLSRPSLLYADPIGQEGYMLHVQFDSFSGEEPRSREELFNKMLNHEIGDILIQVYPWTVDHFRDTNRRWEEVSHQSEEETDMGDLPDPHSPPVTFRIHQDATEEGYVRYFTSTMFDGVHGRSPDDMMPLVHRITGSTMAAYNTMTFEMGLHLGEFLVDNSMKDPFLYIRSIVDKMERTG